MSTEYCISTNALGLIPLMRTKATARADERRENRKPDAGADPVGGFLAAADDVGVEAAALKRFGQKISAENLRYEEGRGGNSFGHQPCQPDENPRRQEACGDGGRGEVFLTPLPVVECEDDAPGDRAAEGGGPRDTHWGVQTVCGRRSWETVDGASGLLHRQRCAVLGPVESVEKSLSRRS
jgi:hypothetical protein